MNSRVILETEKHAISRRKLLKNFGKQKASGIILQEGKKSRGKHRPKILARNYYWVTSNSKNN